MMPIDTDYSAINPERKITRAQAGSYTFREEGSSFIFLFSSRFTPLSFFPPFHETLSNPIKPGVWGSAASPLLNNF